MLIRALVVLLLFGACGGSAPQQARPAAPSVPDKLETVVAELQANGEWFDALMTAAQIADEVYNEIADTPITEIDAKAAALGDKVSKARDALRRAESYGFVPRKLMLDGSNELKFRVAYEGGCGQGIQTGDYSCDFNAVTVPGHKLKLSIQVIGPHANIKVLSSRNKDLMYLFAAGKLADPSASHSPILLGDHISIPDLTKHIKR